MSLSGDLKNQYSAVLEDLEREREQLHQQVGNLQRQLREMDNGITTIRRRIDPNLDIATKAPSVIEMQPSSAKFLPEQKYAFVGVRWAILHLLNESGAMTTSDIAENLKASGVRTKAVNFANNVSAVLSQTMRPRGKEEVESFQGKWRLTEIGKNKIAHIMTTQDFLRDCPWARSRPDASAGAAH